MNDDLEPRLGDHLRHRASRVQVAPDLGDVHHRIDQRHQRRTRALGAALALALVAGPLVGWTLARANEPDRDTLTAAGGGGADDAGESPPPSFVDEQYRPQGSTGDIDAHLAPVSARTTEQGIRLVVHTTGLASSAPSCAIDGVVRVGVVDGDVIDVVHMETGTSGSQFLVAGVADDRPMWVVVARGFQSVVATFPNGASDRVEATDGLAVLAAYADPGASLPSMTDDVIELEGEGREAATALLADGSGGCGVEPPVPPVDLTMPEPGEPPADEASARAEIEELFSGVGGQDPTIEMDKHERPNVWRDADARFREEHPEYLEWAKQTYSVPREIVFTAPDRATVRYDLLSDNPDVPAPGERIGEAVLVDGVWKMSIETSCGNLGLAGIECDYSIEG